MSNLATFGAYAAAFDKSMEDDDWTRLEQYFASDAVYLPGDGTEAIGRAASIQALHDSVEALERKSDSRELIGEPEITEAGDTITLLFKLRYTKKGVPDLILAGCETVLFANGVIQRMEDVFDDPSALMEWRSKV